MFQEMHMTWAALLVGLLATAVFLGRGRILGNNYRAMERQALAEAGSATVVDLKGSSFKKAKSRRNLFLFLGFLALWVSITSALTLIFGKSTAELEVEIFPPTVNFLGFQVSESVLWTWVLIAVVLLLSLAFRFAVFPRFQDRPKGLQNVLEIAVEWVSGYTGNTSEVVSGPLNAYILSIGVIMLGSAVLEMFGVRAPTSDLKMTGAMAIVTFIMVNYYGIRRKGLLGRVKSLAQPTPVVFPFQLISQIATPISLACRLFGNMLGGMIVIDLLYVAMGNAGVGVPGILGLYFNVFHPVIQAYIFITLTLTSIREAVE